MTLRASAPESPVATFTFTGWGGACAQFGTAPECNVTINAAKTVYAAFFIEGFVDGSSATVTAGTRGAGRVGLAYQMGTTCSVPALPTDSCWRIATGVPFTVRAIPSAPARFTGWDGCEDGASVGDAFLPEGQDCTFALVRGIASPTATFDSPHLKVNVRGTDHHGVGAVVSNPGGLDCSTFAGTCTARFDATGLPVVLSAVPDAASAFVGWEACPSVDPADASKCNVDMRSGNDGEVGARFTGEFVLTITKAPNMGTGGFRASMFDPIFVDFDCGPADCTSQQHVYQAGNIVNISAFPQLLGGLASFSGCTPSGPNKCSVAMGNADKTVTITFPQ